MIAARQQDAAVLAAAYRDGDTLILSIDGLQPEKGHETLSVVRELRAKRVWFGEALLSSTTAAIQRLVVKAQQWAEQLGKSVVWWTSDKQEAFLQAIAAVFPDVPHRYCQNHFLRDVAKEVLAADSHAKVPMRTKVRGLRAIERDVLTQRRPADEMATTPTVVTPPAVTPPAAGVVAVPLGDASAVVLDYCTTVRGLLNDSQGGPLAPPGLRRAEALTEVRDSIQRNVDAKKGGVRKSN
jgi:hypothetical protein